MLRYDKMFRTTESGSRSKNGTPPAALRLPLPLSTLGDEVELTAGDLFEVSVVLANLNSRTGVFVARTSQKSGELLGTLSRDEAEEGVTLTPAGPRTPIEWYPQSLLLAAAVYLDDKI